MSRFRNAVAILLVLGACTPAAVDSTDPESAAPATTVDLVPETTAVLQGIEAAAGLGDEYYPGLGNAGYDVEHVTLELTIDPFLPRIEGRATFDATATENLESWSVDLVTMFPSEVLVDGSVAAFEQTGGEVRVTPEDPIRAGRAFVMEIAYSGTPIPFDSVAAPFPTGFLRATDSWFGLSEPEGASSWFPANDHPLDKATYTVVASVPSPFVVAASGRLVDTRSEETGFLTYTWEAADPLASYLLAFAVGDLEREDVETDGIPIRNYYDEDLPSTTKDLFARQPEMMAFLEELFGPYPFEVYGALVLDTQDLGAALETQTLSTFGEQSLPLGEDVVVHELAHQWYGNSVSVAQWRDIWLNEGFATYAQWLWLEHSRGEAARNVRIVQAYELMSGQVFLGQGIERAAAADLAASQFPAPGRPPVDDLFNASVYLRGGLTLHALRIEVGDEAFFATLRDYHDTYRYGNATTDDFIAVAEESAGRELGEFFEGWLFADSIPSIPSLDLHPLTDP